MIKNALLGILLRNNHLMVNSSPLWNDCSNSSKHPESESSCHRVIRVNHSDHPAHQLVH